MPDPIALDLDVFRKRYSALQSSLEALASPPPRIVTITKYLSAEDSRILVEQGFGPRGENRAQSLVAKVQDSDDRDDWHFVGRLQRNKVDDVIPRIGLLHSLDSERLAVAIHKHLEKHDSTVRALVQLNVSGEETKTGLDADEALEVLPKWAVRFPRIEFGGLMTMAPVAEPETCRPIFRDLRQSRDQIQHALPDDAGEVFTDLSMGMSNDYSVATEEGATWIRIGRALYS